MTLSVYKSWYPEGNYTEAEQKYFKMIEAVYSIQLGSGAWEKIKLTNHQREFHSNDICIKGKDAKYDIVIKSRNTSFTISSLIRLFNGNYNYRDGIVPLNRISEQKVKELIDEAYKLVKHMTPIKIEFCKNCKQLKKKCSCDNQKLGIDYWPFNPKIVKKKALSLEFPDRKVVWQGYGGLSPTTAEIIRGTRTFSGFMDEVAFITYFKEIYTAMRDSSRGAVLKNGVVDEDDVHHQITLGSTIKGWSKFYYWFLDLEKKVKEGKLNNFRILKWPVFDFKDFDPEKPFENWDKKVTIVPWHTKTSMKEKINEDMLTFLEEYMAIITPSDTQLYNIAEIQDICLSEQWATDKNILSYEFPPGSYYMGIDPAGEGGHFFAISIFYENPDTLLLEQIYINQEKNSDLTEREDFIKQLIEHIPFTKLRIDGNGLAYQMSQNLKKQYPSIVEVFRGRVNVKTVNKQTININEYLHTNQIMMIKRKQVNYINDELQLKQFAGWNRKYKADEDKELGHCDSTVANGLALLPLNWKIAGREHTIRASGTKEEPEATVDEIKEEVKKFHKSSLKQRMKFYKKR